MPIFYLFLATALLSGCHHRDHIDLPSPAAVGEPASDRVNEALVEKPASNGVNLETSAPEVIRLELPITVQLHNHQAKEVMLSAPTPCDIFLWEVLTMSEKPVQSKPNKPCPQVVAYYILAPGETLKREYKIPLDLELYNADERYRLRYRFWKDYEGFHDFTVKSPY